MIVPATTQEPIPLVGMLPQVPATWPAGIVHLPPQHWSFVTHVSEFCRQNEPELVSHLPLVQTFEQQVDAVAAVQLLPAPLHTPPLIA